MTEQVELHATERWFARRGLPMFIEEYDNGRDVWTRALPALVAVFFLNTVAFLPLSGVTVEAGPAGDVVGYDLGALLGALLTTGLLVVAYAVANRVRGRRAFALPERVGPPVLAAFLLVPAVIDLAATRSVAAAAQSLVLNAMLLALIWVVTRYALLALVWWAVRRVWTQFGDVYRLATRALPLLLLVITILFLTTEVWQVAGTMDAKVLWGSLAFFLLLALAFVWGQATEEMGGLELEQSRESVMAACARTPMAPFAGDLAGLDRAVPLSGRQRANLALALVTSRVVQVTLVALLVWVFFVAFGVFAVSVPVQEAWLGDLVPVDSFVTVFDGHGVTRPLLRVATFLAGFSAFYVTVSGATDPAYRENFFRGIGESFAGSLAVRRAYLARRRERGLSAPEPTGPPAG